MKLSLPFLTHRVTAADRAFVARQLATMMTSGLSIDRASAVLANQVANPVLAGIFRQVETDLEAGLSFSKAIVKHPKVFNKVFVNVIVAGEAVGKVAEVLQEMALRLEKEQEFTSKIRAALYYPLFVFVATLLIGIALMIWVIPQFKEVFIEAGVNLPVTTSLLITISEFLSQNWWMLIFSLLLFVVFLKFYLASPQGKLTLDFLLLRVPGGLAKDLYMARFTRTLALLVESGTPIIEALAITSEVINNRFYADTVMKAKEDIARGIPLSVPLSKSPLFPLIVPQMVLVGEQTGRLDSVLTSLADYYEQETDVKLKALSSLFEPAMIIIVGGAVAFIVFSIFVPLYTIAQF